MFIHRQILAFAANGGAVLLVSEELDELLSLADRIVVLYRGAIVGEVLGEHRTISRIGRMMLGEAA
jgi:simple sugar transport system ATP-binding protein